MLGELNELVIVEESSGGFMTSLFKAGCILSIKRVGCLE